MPDLVRRRAARVLVVDPDGRLLLMHGFDPQKPSVGYWFTPGGGLQPGESMEQAAVREMGEETGFAVSPTDLGSPVWHDVTVFSFEGRTYEQSQDYFLLRVPCFTAAPVAFEAHEARSVRGLAWWTLESLAATTETFHPACLVGLVTGLLAEGAVPDISAG